MADGWRYIAERITGDGPGRFLSWSLPITNPKLTDVLSGPPQFTGTIDHAQARLLGPDGLPLLLDKATAIYAERDREIRGGWILQNTSETEDEQLEIDASGFCGYPTDKPYLDEYSAVDVDPADVVRRIWEHLQTFPGGQLGMTVGDTTTAVRIGTPKVEGDDTTGPFEMNYWSTDDLGAVIEELAKATPFDYHERHAWNADRTQILHFLDIGYPRLGSRRDLRFVLGENITLSPVTTFGSQEAANEVVVLGAGEGRDQIRASAAVRDGRIREVATITDSHIQTQTDAENRARRELGARQGMATISQLHVRDHRLTRVGSWSVGDDIRVLADTAWAPLDMWVRIVGSEISPDDGDDAVLTVRRMDTL
jgi:hypothetical protein